MHFKSTQRRSALIFLLAVGPAISCFGEGAESTVSFNRDIRPILADRCFACHGPDGGAREAELRLDKPDGPDGAHAAAIKPGSIDESELWQRITSDDEDIRMPPPSAKKPTLNEDELRFVKAWIESGAKYDTHWAFRSPANPPMPSVSDSEWSEHPIDRYVLNALESAGLQPSNDATARTLIRRLTLDLTGLPPTREEVHAFVKHSQAAAKDASPDWAFEELWSNSIDELLSRPQFGEHMARYWLDVVRFADTNGMHKDFYRNNVAYRDWVIRAFNENLSYDEFVRYQLAGDLFENPTKDQLIASGFHRLHLIIDRGTALPEESFTKNVIDRLTSFGTAFMGMTVHCAQCHDHKYDPITQREFYSLYAFFNNIDAEPETGGRPRNGLQSPFVSLATPEQQQSLDDFDERINRLNQRINKTKAELEEQKSKLEKDGAEQGEAGDKPKPSEAQEQAQKQTIEAKTADLKRLEEDRKQLQQKRQKFNDTVSYAMVMKERKDVRPTHILVRGQYDVPGDVVERNTPAFLPPLEKSGDVATRMDLANWLTTPEHPLTARVAVNRFWQQFFGVGLVQTSEDLGVQGNVPTHPELLEHLTKSFVDSDWDIRRLVKRIVKSRTYRQSSLSTPEQFKSDPNNLLLARGSRFRLDAEVIRDQILSTSGLLSKKMFGVSVKPPQPDGLWKAVTMTGQRFQADTGEAAQRRSLYTFWKRAMPPPQMTILNAPTRAACVARRERTNTPSQALLLLNETECHKAARELAISTLQQKSDSAKPMRTFVDFMWETVTSQLPDTEERKAVRLLVKDLTATYRDNPALADKLCEGADLDKVLREGEKPAIAKARLAAWTMVASTLYNLDITKTRE